MMHNILKIIIEIQEVFHMRKGVTKFLSLCIMAAVLSFTCVAAPSAYAENTECTDNLSIDSYAANIKSIYKAKYPEQADLIEEIVDSIISDKEFIKIFEFEGAEAFQIMEESLCDALNPEPMPLIMTDDLYTSKYSFPKVQQIEKYYCGPASTVMALIGSGAKDYYYTREEKQLIQWQRDVVKDYGMQTDKEEKTQTYEITNVLKKMFRV